MKREYLCLLCALLLMGSLAACGRDNDTPATDNNPAQESQDSVQNGMDNTAIPPTNQTTRPEENRDENREETPSMNPNNGGTVTGDGENLLDDMEDDLTNDTDRMEQNGRLEQNAASSGTTAADENAMR